MSLALYREPLPIYKPMEMACSCHLQKISVHHSFREPFEQLPKRRDAVDRKQVEKLKSAAYEASAQQLWRQYVN